MPVIIGAKDGPPECVSEEVWLKIHFPGCREAAQFLVSQNGRMMDVLNIILADGTERSIVFDVSDTL
jgi:hypothetical protein